MVVPHLRVVEVHGGHLRVDPDADVVVHRAPVLELLSAYRFGIFAGKVEYKRLINGYTIVCTSTNNNHHYTNNNHLLALREIVLVNISTERSTTLMLLP